MNCKCSIINDAETHLELNIRIQQNSQSFNKNQIYSDINNLMHGLCHETFLRNIYRFYREKLFE